MTKPLADLKQFLGSLDTDFDARVAAAADDPNSTDPAAEWQPDPDPFELDWEWLCPPQPDRTGTPPASESSTTRESLHRNLRPVWTARLTCMAASLLLGTLLGWLVFGRGLPVDQLQLLAADATVSFGPPRGGQPQPSVTVSSPFAGFATVIGLAPDRKQQLIPVSGGADIPVPAGGISAAVPLRAYTTRAVIIVTPTPAAEALRRELDAPTAPRYSPDDAEDLIKRIQQTLINKGHRRIAFGSMAVKQTD